MSILLYIYVHTYSIYTQGVIDICTIDFQIHCPYRLQVSVHMSVAASIYSWSHNTTGTQLNPLIYNGVVSGSVVDYITSTGRTALHAALFFLSNLPTDALNRLSTSSMVAGVMQYNIFSSEQHEPCSTIVCGQPTLKGPFNPITNFQN